MSATVSASFTPVRREMTGAMVDLGRRLAAAPLDAVASDCLARLQELTARFAPEGSGQVRYDMRQTLWKLRQSFAVDALPPLDTRRAFERLRAVCLDNGWERALRGCPRMRATVQPRIAHVPNFDCLERSVMRGALPTQEGADWLVSRAAVKVVIDLTEASDAPWAPVAWANVSHHHIPVHDFQAPTYAQMKEIIALLDHPPADGAVYLHCKAGVGRTGVAIACWRVSHGWSPQQAIEAESLNTYDASLMQAEAVHDFAAAWRAEHGSAGVGCAQTSTLSNAGEAGG